MDVTDFGIETTPNAPANAAQHSRSGLAHGEHGGACQNCGADLTGRYCHACGQEGHVHRSLIHIAEEFLHGITHLDSRAWRSLPLLAFRPGTLTRSYVMGQRARYVPPFAMFLFSIFAMFFAFAFSGGPGFVSYNESTQTATLEELQGELRDARATRDQAARDVENARAEVTQLSANADRNPGELEGAQGALTGAQAALTAAQRDLEAAQAVLEQKTAQVSTEVTAQDGASPLNLNDPSDRERMTREFAAEREKLEKAGDTAGLAALSVAESLAMSAEAPKDEGSPSQTGSSVSFSEAIKTSMREGKFTVNTPWPGLNKKIKEKTANPDLLFYKVQNTAYKFSFLLIPLSLPFLWLMFFWKKGVTLYDHSVFALYSLSFVSFVFLAISLLAHWVPATTTIGWTFLIFPVHLYFHFKGAYALGWFSALWRTILFCTVFAWAALAVFLSVIIALGVTG